MDGNDRDIPALHEYVLEIEFSWLICAAKMKIKKKTRYFYF